MINKRVFVAGHKGLLGASIVKLLNEKNEKIYTAEKRKVDLKNYNSVFNFLKKNKINQIYLCAGIVGGIYANQKFPVQFLEDNTLIQFNVIKACFELNIKKLIFYASSTIYSNKKNSSYREDDISKSPITGNHACYSLSKITAIKLAESYMEQYPEKKLDFKALVLCSLFGSNDKFDSDYSHALPAITKKAILSKRKNLKNITIWGSGTAKREFIHTSEVATASHYLMHINATKFKKLLKNKIHINIGLGKDYSIIELCKMIFDIIDYRPKIIKDIKKPEGVKKKLLNISLIKKLGWTPSKSFKKMLQKYVLSVEHNGKF
tara:strand:- start:1421 stop:2380 length:960 start_codon:yes stop_codon:yes gene_type:complete